MPLNLAGNLDTFAIRRQTATADTVIVSTVPPRKFARTKLTYLEYTSGGTAHTLTYMRELGRTKVTTAVAGSGTSIILAQDPGLYSLLPEWVSRGITPSTSNNAIAASDYFVVQLKDGTFLTATVSSCVTNADGTVTLTVSAIPAAGIAANATFWFMGVPGDTDPHFNAANPSNLPTISTTTSYPGSASGGGSAIAQSFHMESPLLIHSTNATAAGSINQGQAVYSMA